jgi:protein SCO1
MRWRPGVTLTVSLLLSCTAPAPNERSSAEVPPWGAAAAAADGAHLHHPGEPLAPLVPLPLTSIYQLDVPWYDGAGSERHLAELQGTPQAVAMVYTTCGSACPLIVADLKRLESEFEGLGLVLVSIDPSRDTPEQLASFAAATRLGPRWTVLGGTDDSVAELAAVLGVRYRRISDTDFMHSNIITVLDAGGSIVHRQEARGELDGTRAALRQVAESQAAPQRRNR